MSVNQVYHISGLLEKMTNVDKDFRYMAVNDLMAELSKQSITLDEDMERRIVRALLTLIQDKNGEVQNLACRCLGPLVHKIKLAQLETLVDSLCANMVSQNEQLRDVSSIALKTVLNELPSGSITSQMFLCVRRVIPKLIETLKTDYKGSSSVKLEVLDILGSLILRYGRTFNLMFDEIENILFVQLEKERQTMRKRAISTVGHLADVVGDEQFDRIVEKVLGTCADSETELSSLKTFIISVITICRTSGARFAKFLPQIVPILIQKCESVEDDELHEICLQAFEIFAFRCTNELSPFVPSIVKISVEMVSYDPNYNYGAEEEGEEMEMDNPTQEDGETEEQDDAYSDDDDLSWKVRKSAAKCIEALITFRTEKLSESYDHFGPLLISRFREREDNVKYDIFAAYSALLRLTKQMNPELASFQAQNAQGGNELLVESFPPSRFEQIRKDEFSKEQKAVFAKLQKQDKHHKKHI
ncbi:hypothetical protein niasHS_014886 [Heterodera schachtii]|uniref:Serine/threonine-protein kinase mTOR domain-containing protein n=1 Tax=Heterodera schachtii TaxID=97005 RepID=A0ABD2INB5_HETSC